MQSRRHLVLSIVTVLALGGYAIGPSAVRGVEARHVFLPTAHDIVAAQFAAEAAHIGSLHGINTGALLRRFSARARLHAHDVPGQATNGDIVNPNNWTLSPAGTQSDLGDFPVTAVPSPDGSRLLVVNSGAGVQSIQILTMPGGAVLQTIPFTPPHSVFVGAAYSPDGKHVYVSGGGENVIHTFSVASDGTLTANGDVVESKAPANLTFISSSSYPTGLSVSRDGKLLFVANSNADNVAVVDTTSQTVTSTVAAGYAPYTTIVNPTTGNVYVSNWGDATLSVLDPSGSSVIATIPVGRHPTAMTFGPTGMLYVTDSNDDAVSIVDPTTNSEISRVSVISDPTVPLSSSPQGLAISHDGRTLYVADAGNNAISVLSLTTDGRSAYFQGWIPTAWYPTNVVVSPNDDTLFVTNGFGLGEHANNGPLHPDPTRPTPNAPLIQGPGYCNCSLDQFSGTMDIGTLSTIPVPSPGQLRSDTIRVTRNDHFFDLSPLDRSQNNPIPEPGGTSPIKHVIYIVKENRTYDQVFGDVTPGNGDPSLTLFGQSITPNLHALAARFGILDNFYADAQVSADGHNWTLSANANDYTEKTWPQDYSTPGRNFGYPFESGNTIALSPGGYLWDNAATAGISYRDYGLYAAFDNLSTAVIQPESQPCAGPSTPTYIGKSIPPGYVLCFAPTSLNKASTPNLIGHIDPRFINYDMGYPDVQRVAEWKREFSGFVANNNLPALEMIRLSNDHTRGTAKGTWTPQRFASDNDAAVGQLVDTVSHSPYWSSTAIFVVEDDAQNGPDHVDSHRTEALVISPYTSQSAPRAESTHYDTAAMVRTIELILGLKPLSQYDATAMPMWHLFGSTPDTAPYDAASQGVTTGTTTARMFGARESGRLNFALPDAAASLAMNHILWHAIKGAKVPYPGPYPYGIPKPGVSHYVWGELGVKAYPLLRYQGMPKLRIIRAPVNRPHR